MKDCRSFDQELNELNGGRNTSNSGKGAIAMRFAEGGADISRNRNPAPASEAMVAEPMMNMQWREKGREREREREREKALILDQESRSLIPTNRNPTALIRLPFTTFVFFTTFLSPSLSLSLSLSDCVSLSLSPE